MISYRKNDTYTDLPAIDATEEQLSWFGIIDWKKNLGKRLIQSIPEKDLLKSILFIFLMNEI